MLYAAVDQIRTQYGWNSIMRSCFFALWVKTYDGWCYTGRGISYDVKFVIIGPLLDSRSNLFYID